MEHVDAGDAEWVFTLGRYLAAGTEGCLLLETTITMALVLPVNPTAVLALETSMPGFSMEHACGFPFIEPAYELIAEHGARALAALPPPRFLMPVNGHCLYWQRSGGKTIPRFCHRKECSGFFVASSM